MTLVEWAQVSQVIVGIAIIFSVYVSIKALKKSDWQSAMNTAPTIVVRLQYFFLRVYNKEGAIVSSSLPPGKIIEPSSAKEIVFDMRFDCINVGRGGAFNISSRPSVSGVDLDTKNLFIPLNQFIKEDIFYFNVSIRKDYSWWIKKIESKLPIRTEVFITYNNDQGNVYCKSVWNAKITPFIIEEGKLKVKRVRILNRVAGVSYSRKPFMR